jgi:hypothetical protein
VSFVKANDGYFFENRKNHQWEISRMGVGESTKVTLIWKKDGGGLGKNGGKWVDAGGKFEKLVQTLPKRMNF